MDKTVKWPATMKHDVRKALATNGPARLQGRLEKLDASIRTKIEHHFRLAKNEAPLFSLLDFAKSLLTRLRTPAAHTDMLPDGRNSVAIAIGNRALHLKEVFLKAFRERTLKGEAGCCIAQRIHRKLSAENQTDQSKTKGAPRGALSS